MEVEALHLLLGGDAHPDEEVEDLEEGEARHTDPEEVRADADELGDELAAVPVEEPRDARCRATIPAASVGAVGEEAEGDETPRTVDTVDGDRADRVIDLHPVLDEERRFHDEDARDRADEDRDGRVHERAGRGDRDHPGEHPVDCHRRVRAL